MITHNKYVWLLILCVFIVCVKGFSVGKNEDNDSQLTNIDGYRQQRKIIMDKYYARQKKLYENINQFTKDLPDVPTTVLPAIMKKSTVYGECKNSSVLLISITINISGGSSSSRSFEHTGQNSCIDCVRITTAIDAEDYKVIGYSGGPGNDRVHLQFSSIGSAKTSITITIMGRNINC